MTFNKTEIFAVQPTESAVFDVTLHRYTKNALWEKKSPRVTKIIVSGTTI